MMTNCWDDVDIGCMKRVSVKHNLFWAKDYNGSIAFIIELENIKIRDIPIIKIAGMQIIYKEDSGDVRIYLVLNDLKDIEIFSQLCLDLIDTIDINNDQISAVLIINRLKQWQTFLSSNRNLAFSIEKQIGLFGELSFIYYKLFPLLGISNSILSWVGPNKDKQDFRFAKMNVEVKTYLDNRRGVVNISSIEQLNPSNGKLYLYTYGLKMDENGKNIKEFVKLIRENIVKNNIKDLHVFNNLIEEYGYFDGYNYENLLRLSIFEESMFNVDDTFPKLPINIKKNEIKSIQYTIDLNLCTKYLIPETELNLIKEEE